MLTGIVFGSFSDFFTPGTGTKRQTTHIWISELEHWTSGFYLFLITIFFFGQLFFNYHSN